MLAIDFFCGCGGASEGFRQAGFDIALGLDIDPRAANTYRANFPEADFIESDICKVTTKEVEDIVNLRRNGPLLLTACAPCQPFSAQNKFKSHQDERNSLLDETHRFIVELKPDYIVIENVPGIQKVDQNTDGPFQRFLTLLDENGYRYNSFVAKAQDYGVPQKRKRLVILASLLAPIDTPAPTHGTKDELAPYVTVRDFIEGYPVLNAGEAHEDDPAHVTARMNELNLLRIKNTPEGGDRRNWPSHLVNDCHKTYTGHTDTYGRMSWDKLAPTLTTKCNSYSNGRFGHPDTTQHRAISIREASRLQTFPEDFIFEGTIGSMARQVGNAVPCELARQFGLSLSNHFNNLMVNQ